jgi:hypothetical protein
MTTSQIPHYVRSLRSPRAGFKNLYLAMTVAALLLGCREMRPMNKNNENEIIATFSPSALDVQRVDELFMAHRIEYYIHGSRVYAISVPSRSVSDAVKLLRQSEFVDKITICGR